VSRKRASPRQPPESADNCRDAIGLLGEYMEGALAAALVIRLEEHLANCPACEGFLQSLRSTRAAVRNLRSDDIPEKCRARLRAFLDRELKTGTL
jgi:anti-sigma factor RsiW